MEKKNIVIIVFVTIFVLLLAITVISVPLLLISHNTNPVLKSGPKLLIDHDGGADDAMAIFLTLLYEKYFNGPQLIGLTTSHGNVDETQAFENTQRILDLADRRDVPIYRGVNYSLVYTHESDFYYGFDGLGDLDDVKYQSTAAQPEHAVSALIELSKTFEGELVVVVIGAVTNIALAIRIDPQFISRLSHLYVAAGNIYSEDFKTPEFNALIDVEAYHIVAENSTPEKVTFIPFSPFYTAHNISMDWRDNVLGAIDTDIMKQQNLFERISNNGSKTWTELDPNALAMVLNNDLIGELDCSKNSIIMCGDQRGINTNEFIDCTKSNMKIAYPAPEDGFKDFLYDVFSAELSG